MRRSSGSSRRIFAAVWLACLTVFVSLVVVRGAPPAPSATASLGRVAVVAAPGHRLSSQRFAEAAEVAWCGTGETPANRLPQFDPLATNTVRVFYAYSSDVSDRFTTLADSIVTDIAAVDAWWRTQDSTRSLRWDLYAFPGCTGGIAALDLGVIPLASSSSYYETAGGFGRLLNEVAPHLGAMEKALVYYDGYVIDESICGVSDVAPRNGGRYGMSMISLRSGCWVDLGAAATTARVAIHELGHNLGAVPSKAPNVCGDPSLGGHACDSPTDLMFPYAARSLQLASAVLDVGRDDYYSHRGTWWDVQDSSWLTHLPLRALSVLVSGPGSVRSVPSAIDCPGSCAATLESDSAVTLTARPETGAEFYGWAGGCTGGKDCTVTMSRDITARATFGAPRPHLTIRIAGMGRVTGAPGGVRCPGSCSAKYPSGTAVTLTARPSPGWRFARWSTPHGAKLSCSLVVRTDSTVIARFLRAGK